MGAEPRITSVPHFPELHDFEPYGYVVDIAGGKLTLHTRGDVVRDAQAKEWKHDSVFVEIPFLGVRGYWFENTLFNQQNVLFELKAVGPSDQNYAAIQQHFDNQLLESTKLFELRGTIGLSGWIAADRVEFSERSGRWTAA